MKKCVLSSLLIIGCIVVLSGCRTSINLNDYLEVKFQGYDSVGSGRCEFDSEKMFLNNAKTFGLDGDLITGYSILKSFDYEFDVDIDKKDHLTNGDTVKVIWNNDVTALEKQYKVHFEMEDEKVKVEGLMPVKQYDPFEDVEMIYAGYDAAATVSVDYHGPIDLTFEVIADDIDNLKNGDRITVVLEERRNSTLEEFGLQNGVIFTRTECNYTVSGLKKQVTKLEEIPNNVYEEMNSAALEAFLEQIQEGWYYPSALISVEYLGPYLMTSKDGRRTNALNLIYRITAENVGHNNEPFDFYYFAQFYELGFLEDGSFDVDLTQVQVPWNIFFHGSYRFEGYATFEELYENLIEIHLNAFDCEGEISEDGEIIYTSPSYEQKENGDKQSCRLFSNTWIGDGGTFITLNPDNTGRYWEPTASRENLKNGVVIEWTYENNKLEIPDVGGVFSLYAENVFEDTDSITILSEGDIWKPETFNGCKGAAFDSGYDIQAEFSELDRILGEKDCAAAQEKLEEIVKTIGTTPLTEQYKKQISNQTDSNFNHTAEAGTRESDNLQTITKLEDGLYFASRTESEERVIDSNEYAYILYAYIEDDHVVVKGRLDQSIQQEQEGDEILGPVYKTLDYAVYDLPLSEKVDVCYSGSYETSPVSMSVEEFNEIFYESSNGLGLVLRVEDGIVITLSAAS